MVSNLFARAWRLVPEPQPLRQTDSNFDYEANYARDKEREGKTLASAKKGNAVAQDQQRPPEPIQNGNQLHFT
jgi:hypothetical protein